jgi:hypothetical protein
MRTNFCLRSLKGKDHLEDLGVNRRIILKWIGWAMWAGFVSGRSNWRAVVNTVINFGLNTRREISRLPERLLASREEISL